MLKKTLLFSFSAAIAAFILSSYASGPITGGAGNRTGSAGSAANCSTGGCHAANNTNTVVTMTLLNGTTPVTQYVPGQNYHVVVSGSVTNANLPKFGFQISSVKSTATSVQAGTFSLAGATQSALKTSGALQLVEHTSAINGTGSGNNWTYSKQFDWTAPAAGTGQVKFFFTLNAVNGNANETGDQPNNTSVTIDENVSTNITNLEEAVIVKAYPNPVKNQLNISLENASGVYDVSSFDGMGRKVFSTTTINKTGKTEITIPTSNWSSGLYHILISKDGAEKLITVVKE